MLLESSFAAVSLGNNTTSPSRLADVEILPCQFWRDFLHVPMQGTTCRRYLTACSLHSVKFTPSPSHIARFSCNVSVWNEIACTVLMTFSDVVSEFPER